MEYKGKKRLKSKEEMDNYAEKCPFDTDTCKI